MGGDAGLLIENSEIWRQEMQALRKILVKNGLREEVKWGKPAYLWEGKIIAVMQPFKKYFALLFYNGQILEDKNKLLVPSGPNAKKGRQMRFSGVGEIISLENEIENFIIKAIKHK